MNPSMKEQIEAIRHLIITTPEMGCGGKGGKKSPSPNPKPKKGK